jgi:hypothetical protein
VHALELVVLAFEADRSLAAPHEADYLDRLLERVHRFAARQHRAADRFDGVEASARAEPELDTPTRDEVERRRGLAENRGRAEREVGNVRKDVNLFGAHGHRREQRPRVDEPALVRVVLNTDQLETQLIGQRG